MAIHRVFVIAADIQKGQEAALRKHLAGLDAALRVGEQHGYRSDGRTPLFFSLEMLHYASFVVFDRDRLNLDVSKLVFECNIDGAEDAFLDRLLDDPAVDRIYEHCVDYDSSVDKAHKRAWLRERIKRPQLFHIGAPYRSAVSIRADRDLRRVLDNALDGLMRPSLGEYRARTPAGMREYWRWEIFKPWVAWLIAAIVPGAALGFGYVAYHRVSTFSFIVILAAFIGVGIPASVAARKLWVTALPDLRDRVRPWLRWAVAALLLSALVSRLWAHHRNWAVSILGVFLLLVAQSVWAAVRRRWNERLLEIRNNSTSSVIEIWRVLQQQARGVHDRSEWWHRVRNWWPWPVAYAALFGFVSLFSSYRWTLVFVFTALLFLKTLWLSVLLGWPAADEKHRIYQDKTRIRWFVGGVTAAGFAGLVVLTELGCPPALLAAIVLAAFFTLWTMPLPSPNVAVSPLDPDRLEEVCAAEDRDAVNHMAAVVPLRQDRRYRVPILRSFLWILNRFYFRSLLAEGFRGKLWGIPTVHFAQWVLLDSRNYLFLSNYDNSWTAYLDDFGAHLTTGLQKIWGQGELNPGTKDLGRFKDFARSTMVTHSLWYRAYPGLAVRQVWNNKEIRLGLATARQEEAMVRTLRRMGAAPKVLPDQLHARVL